MESSPEVNRSSSDDGFCSHQTSRRVELVVGPYIHSIICILGFLGNGLVIVTYAFYKSAKSMTDVFLLNVAVADLLFVASLPLIVYNELSSWSMGPAACKLLRGSYSVNLYSGALLLACVGADRYLAIVRAHRRPRLRSPPYGRVVCAAVWVSASLLSFPTFYFYDRYDASDSFDEVVFLDDGAMDETPWPLEYVCEFRFADNVTAWNTKVAVPVVQLLVGFLLPLVVIVFCYAAIGATLLRAGSFRRHKAVRVVLAVVAAFVACHLPYNVTLLYDTANAFRARSCDSSDALLVTKMATQTLAYLHCCLNPLLYAFVGVKFRNHFRRIVRDLWCVGRSYVTPPRLSGVTSDLYASARHSADASSENGSSFTV